MQSTRQGLAHVFGDNINTDIISPPQYMELSARDAAKYAMSSVDPEFASRVKPGDIIVAGDNFGSGSSRELAPLSLKHLGVGAVIAKFFARIFYRNAINLGLPVVECAEADKIRPGDRLTVDFIGGSVRNESRGETYACSTLPSHILDLVRKGGLIPHLKERRAGKNGGSDAITARSGEMKRSIPCRGISPGRATGEVLLCSQPIGFNFGFNCETGQVIEHNHELNGVSVKDKILVFPYGKGSTGGSYVVYQLARMGTGPKAVINRVTETIIACGAIMAGLPVVDSMEEDPYATLKNGDIVTVDADRQVVIVEQGGAS